MQGNPGKFFLWIPESWSLESGIEFPQLKTTEYSTWNPQRAIQNPIYCLGFPYVPWDEKRVATCHKTKDNTEILTYIVFSRLFPFMDVMY